MIDLQQSSSKSFMEKIVVDKYLCVRCGQCVITCPSRLFYRKTHLECPSLVEKSEDFCISCNHCVSACPVGAINVAGVGGKDCLPFAKESIPRFEHIVTLAQMRRSIRRYADKPLEDQIINQLMNVVRWAPSAKNGLPVKWIVVNGKEKVHELSGLVIDWMRTLKGTQPMIDAWDRGIDPILRDAPCLIVAYTEANAIWPEIDSAIAVETLDLCAAAMRLGACWAGFFIRGAQNDAKINCWLGLTETQTVQGGLMVGYVGDEVYQKIPHRPELVVKWIK